MCDGTEYYNVNSPIFDQAGRYLPNLTDDRFLMGSNIPGGVGGANQVDTAHVHATKDHVLTADEMPNHAHDMIGVRIYPGGNDYQSGSGYDQRGSGTTTYTGGDLPHNHGNTESGGGVYDNKPQYLTCLYIMRTEYPAEGATGYETFLVKTP